jgi:hypothetical protein
LSGRLSTPEDNQRQWDKIDALCSNMTDVKVAIARIEAKLEGTHAAKEDSGILNTVTSKNSSFYMAITSIIITIGGVLNSIMGSK